MEQLMKLRNAIEEGLISIGTESIKYEPDDGSVMLRKTITGYPKDQYFESCKLSWKLIQLEEGQLALLATTSTKQFLTFRGKQGMKHFRDALNHICKELWSSAKLDLIAKSISKEDYNGMSNAAQQSLKQIWIGTRANVKDHGEYREVIYYIDVKKRLKRITLYSKNSEELSLCQQIRPIIYLPEEILIDLSTKILYKDYNDFAKMKLSGLIAKFEKNKKIEDVDISELKKVLKMM